MVLGAFTFTYSSYDRYNIYTRSAFPRGILRNSDDTRGEVEMGSTGDAPPLLNVVGFAHVTFFNLIFGFFFIVSSALTFFLSSETTRMIAGLRVRACARVCVVSYDVSTAIPVWNETETFATFFWCNPTISILPRLTRFNSGTTVVSRVFFSAPFTHLPVGMSDFSFFLVLLHTACYFL